MKRVLTVLAAMLLAGTSFACDVCEKRQPKFLKGISHGGGPEGNIDYVIVWATILIVLATLYFSIQYLVRPKEKEADHIKLMVID